MSAAPVGLSRGVLITVVILALAAIIGYGVSGTRFPEMSLVEPGGPEVAVRLPHGTGSATRFEVAGGYSILLRRRGSENFVPWRRGEGRGLIDIVVAPSGLRVTGPDGTVFAEAVNGVLRLIATSLRRAGSSAPIWGCVEIERTDERNLRAINAIDMETYVQGVILSEMGARFPLEALKAQAVAARSYAWAKITASRRRGATRILRRTDVDQVFRATDVVPETIRRAVRETRGELLGAPATPLVAYYHSTCGGRTRNAAPNFDPSSPIRGTSCDHCRHSRYYAWRRAYTYRFLGRAFAPFGVKGAVRALRVADVGQHGRVETFAVTHAGGITNVRGHKVRSAINRIAKTRDQQLLSTFVSVARTPGGVRVTGHGWGHGVGMCQMGAATLARNGLSHREILDFYYPDIPLSRGWGQAEP